MSFNYRIITNGAFFYPQQRFMFLFWLDILDGPCFSLKEAQDVVKFKQNYKTTVVSETET